MSVGPDQNKLEPVWEQRAAKCHAKVLEVLNDHPDWSYAQAWKFAAEQSPELFNGKDALSAKAVNELASKARAQAIDQVVKAVQKGTKLSYHDAWQIAEANNRELFHPQERRTFVRAVAQAGQGEDNHCGYRLIWSKK